MSDHLRTLWGLSPDQLEAMSATARGELEAATERLGRYLKPNRMHSVVRRQASSLGGRTLLELVHNGRTAELLQAAREMFDLRRVQP